MDGSGMVGPAAASGSDPDSEHENKVGDVVVHAIAAVSRKLGPLGRKVADVLPEHT